MDSVFVVNGRNNYKYQHEQWHDILQGHCFPKWESTVLFVSKARCEKSGLCLMEARHLSLGHTATTHKIGALTANETRKQGRQRPNRIFYTKSLAGSCHVFTTDDCLKDRARKSRLLTPVGQKHTATVSKVTRRQARASWGQFETQKDKILSRLPAACRRAWKHSDYDDTCVRTMTSGVSSASCNTARTAADAFSHVLREGAFTPSGPRFRKRKAQD